MAVIEVEILTSAFQTLVGYAVKSGRAVPVPTLPSFGEHRLISKFRWKGELTLTGAFEGYNIPAGTLLMKSSVEVSHVSIAELKANTNAPGISLTATAWIKVAFSNWQIRAYLVGFDAGQGPAVLPYPSQLASVNLPGMAGINIVTRALVASSSVVVLRFGTSPSDDLLQAPANRLPTVNSQPDAGRSDWLIHLPPAIFVEIVLERLQKAFSDLPGGTIIEEAPRASWINRGNGSWGVEAKGGIKKVNACPGLIEDADVSVEISVSVDFNWNTTDQLIDMNLSFDVNASDWDTFKCWLGSPFAILNVMATIVNPYQGVALALATLLFVSEKVRSEVAEEAGSQSIGGLTKISGSDNPARYKGTVPVDPLPHSNPQTLVAGFGADGFQLRGNFLAIIPSDHQPVFSPNEGPLTGTWQSKPNCSLRKFDHYFDYQSIIISDNLVLGNKITGSVPVTVFLTSYTEPTGKCWIDGFNSGPHLAVPIKTSGMHTGDAGFAVLHTSAGIRAYHLAALPVIPQLVIGTENLINKLCDSFHIPSRLIDRQELKWIEPPPDYHWGYEPLRQWQIVLRGISENMAIDVLANSEHGKKLATRKDFSIANNTAVIELLTNDKTNLFLRISHPVENATQNFMTRWVLPRYKQEFKAPLNSLEKSGSTLTLHSIDEEMTFDLADWNVYNKTRYTGKSESTLPKQQSVSIAPGSIAVIYEGNLIIGTPLNTLIPGERKSSVDLR